MSTPDDPTTPDPITPDLTCPRCRYDLAWIPGQWTTACPLEGTCTECGLIFEWRALMNPALVAPIWFCEHPLRRPRLGVVRTNWHASRPTRFWKAVPIEVPVRWFPLARLVALNVLLAAFLVLASVYAAERPWEWAPRRFRGLDLASWHLRTFFHPEKFRIWERFHAHELLVMSGVFATMPMIFLLLPFTLGKAKVRASQIFRAVAYSTLYLLLVAIVMALETTFSDGWRIFGLRIGFLATTLYLHHLLLVWLVIHWARVCQYLRLEHARGIVACMTIMGLLVGATIWLAGGRTW